MKIMDQLDPVTENEIDLLCEINHDNIVRYFDHFHKKIGGENKTFLITEYCEVSISNLIYINHLEITITLFNRTVI